MYTADQLETFRDCSSAHVVKSKQRISGQGTYRHDAKLESSLRQYLLLAVCALTMLAETQNHVFACMELSQHD